MKSTRTGTAMSPAQLGVLSDCQKVWRRNVIWSFLYMHSTIFKCPDQSVIQEELLELSDQYGHLLAQYYGYDAGRLFASNLHQHFIFYIQYLDALVAGRSEEAADAAHKLDENAYLTVDQLSALNSHWREMEWRGMLTQEIQVLEDAAQRTLAGEYGDIGFSLDIYDNIAAEIADYMAVGIIKHFSIC